ncbi:MAG: sensor histidine kinase [Bacillota bacterium]
MLDTSMLDDILRQTIDTIENSKEQIFYIAESARDECLRVERELNQVRQDALHIIEEVDHWEKEEKTARIRLMEVSRDFKIFGEEDIRKAYENAKDIQIRVALLREKERQLKQKRFELEMTHRKLKQTVSRAENLVSQVGAAMSYLTNNLQNLWDEVGKMQQRHLSGVAIIRAQEEERRRIARGIHDGPAQSLANIVLRAEYCEKLLAMGSENLSPELSDLKRMARTNLEDLRKIIFDLRPMYLDDLGLVAAARRLLGDFQEKTGIQTQFSLLGRDQRYSPALEVALFRILQEALSNVHKHGKADLVRVIMETHPKVVTVVIKDNGIGFNYPPEQEDERFGLRGMQERAEVLRGSFQVNTAPGSGTEIRVRMPVEEE